MVAEKEKVHLEEQGLRALTTASEGDLRKAINTQIWKYVRALSSIGVISAQKSGEGMRGRTTLLGFAQVPASAMQESLEAVLETARKPHRKFN